MKVQLILDGAHAGGTFFLASGREHPDGYRYDAIPGKEHLVSHVMTAEEFEKKSTDILCHFGIPDTAVQIKFIPEARDAIMAGADVLKDAEARVEAMEAKVKAREREIDLLNRAVEELKSTQAQPGTDQPRISDDQLASLDERDRILELLAPIKGEFETPIDVVFRLVDAAKATITAPVSAEPVPETPEAPAPQVDARRAELNKLGKKKLAAMCAAIPGAESITDKAEQIEAILFHEAAPSKAAA